MKVVKRRITMTQQEIDEFNAFKEANKRKEALAAEKEKRQHYTNMVDEKLDQIIPELEDVSALLAKMKALVYKEFGDILVLKSEIMQGATDENKTHTFTNVAGDKRLTLGSYYIDAYIDTVDSGIAMVKDFLGTLSKDDDSRLLVRAVMKLLSRGKEGTLKASRVLQLRKMAEESGSERFIEGVRIIEESYRPVVSKTFVRAERKGKNGEWVNIPLGMTEA
jgi:hypothetical protein